MRNRLIRLFALVAMFCATVAIASPAQAQEWRRPFEFRVQFGRGIDADRVIQQAENHASQLAALLDERDRPGLSARVRDLESQLNVVGQQFDQTTSYYDRRATLASALRTAQGIQNVMRYRQAGFGDYDIMR